VEAQKEVRWEQGGTEPADGYTPTYANHHLGNEISRLEGSVSVGVNVHAPTEDKSAVQGTVFVRNCIMYSISSLHTNWHR
jgi:hypothetical protein